MSKYNKFGQEILDEHQLKLRNKFGFQSFVILSCLIFLNGILQEFKLGFDNSIYSAFIMVYIPTTYYQARGILSGVYSNNKLLSYLFCYGVLSLIALLNAVTFLSHKQSINIICDLVLVLYSLIIFIITFIAWSKNKKAEKNVNC